MKMYLLPKILLVATIFLISSCTSDMSGREKIESKAEIVLDYTYSTSEIELINLINDYRVSVGLNPLEKINHVSYKSEEHNIYMIANDVLNHDGFVDRSENIIQALGAKAVAENIARNYDSPQGAVNAWLNSAIHKANIVGNFTHFGIAINQDAITGKKYYTNIFVRMQ